MLLAGLEAGDEGAAEVCAHVRRFGPQRMWVVEPLRKDEKRFGELVRILRPNQPERLTAGDESDQLVERDALGLSVGVADAPVEGKASKGGPEDEALISEERDLAVHPGIDGVVESVALKRLDGEGLLGNGRKFDEDQFECGGECVVLRGEVPVEGGG